MTPNSMSIDPVASPTESNLLPGHVSLPESDARWGGSSRERNRLCQQGLTRICRLRNLFVTERREKITGTSVGNSTNLDRNEDAECSATLAKSTTVDTHPLVP